jgi:predicted nuclease with TOPRIM domain
VSELSNIPALIERLLCWPLMSSRQRQLSDNAICKDIETAAKALSRMARENEELRVENAKAFARQIASEDHIKELEAERDQQGRYSCELFDEVARLQTERDAIRAKTIEECATANVVIRGFGVASDQYLQGFQDGVDAKESAIRALNQPPEEKEKS